MKNHYPSAGEHIKMDRPGTGSVLMEEYSYSDNPNSTQLLPHT